MALEFSWAGEAARHVGTVVHELLQRIAQQGVQHWDAQRIASLRPYYGAALLCHGVMNDALDNAIAQVEQSLLRTLDDERGRWILAAGHQESACELALSGVLHERVVRMVIDRTFVDENGTRWVIDYKTGSHEGGDVDAFLDREQVRYQQQLERYAALLRLQDERPICLGLYFPMLQGWRSWEA